MAIDEYDAVHSTEGEECEDFVREGSDLHWSLGSPLTWITAEMLQQELKDKNLATNLRQFLNNFVVDVTLQSSDVINIKRHRCIRLRYQSCVNWMEETDILRCNPDFHSNPRYDHVLVNQNDNDRDLTVAHLIELLRCRLPDQSTHDIAVVRMLKPSKWVPKTKWAGVRVYDEKKSLDFVMIKYLIRGAHMIPVFDTKKLSMTYLNDLIDGVMFLRAGN
ncbi:hypothetical protein B0H14DRAFT_3786188 [Mycena olivaceomarginata]|nr:hypothetical protein B0H14DRAFT_3786188 [Mycena olivaceomarginata]